MAVEQSETAMSDITQSWLQCFYSHIYHNFHRFANANNDDNPAPPDYGLSKKRSQPSTKKPGCRKNISPGRAPLSPNRAEDTGPKKRRLGPAPIKKPAKNRPPSAHIGPCITLLFRSTKKAKAWDWAAGI